MHIFHARLHGQEDFKKLINVLGKKYRKGSKYLHLDISLSVIAFNMLIRY